MAGGRPKGTVNKPRERLLRALQEKFGDEFDPVVLMAEQALALHTDALTSGDRQDRESAVSALDKVSKYLVPQLKATEVDVSSSDGSMSPVRQIRLVAVDERGELLGTDPYPAVEGDGQSA